jgi:hypothetical protein
MLSGPYMVTIDGNVPNNIVTIDDRIDNKTSIELTYQQRIHGFVTWKLAQNGCEKLRY